MNRYFVGKIWQNKIVSPDYTPKAFKTRVETFFQILKLWIAQFSQLY